jgi:hypothetical protein
MGLDLRLGRIYIQVVALEITPRQPLGVDFEDVPPSLGYDFMVARILAAMLHELAGIRSPERFRLLVARTVRHDSRARNQGSIDGGAASDQAQLRIIALNDRNH